MKTTTALIARYLLPANNTAFSADKSMLIGKAQAAGVCIQEIAVFQDDYRLCRVIGVGEIFYGEVTEVADTFDVRRREAAKCADGAMDVERQSIDVPGFDETMDGDADPDGIQAYLNNPRTGR